MHVRQVRFLLGGALAALLLSTLPASAQMSAKRYGESKFEITPQASYFFSTDIAFSKADLNIKDGAGYGLTLGIKVQRDLQVELFWVGTTLSTELLEYKGPGLPQNKIDEFDVGVNYFMLGATQMLKGRNIKPFGTFAVGAAWMSPGQSKQANVTLEDEVRFAVGFGAGVKIFFTENVGLRLHGRLLMPLVFTGGGFYFGTGGAGFGVSSGIPALQGDLSAGLIIGLGD